MSGVATANLNATCRNENTNQSVIKTTVADGKLIFNLGSTVDFSNGWNVGDKVSVFSLYAGFEQKFSFTIPAALVTINIKDNSGADVGSFKGGFGMNGFLDLVESPTSPSLRYFTIQEFLDHYELKTKEVDSENGIELLQLTRIGESVEQQIDSDTNTKFDNNNGSFYSSSAIEGGESPEYHDAKFAHDSISWLKFTPINELTTFEINQVASGGTPSWVTLTESNNEISVDKQTGRVQIINTSKLAAVGPRQKRATYTFGRSTTPTDIRLLAIIETGIKLMGAAFIARKAKKLSDVEFGDITNFDAFRARVIKKYRNHNITPT